MSYELVSGLEIHVQLNTCSKIFSADSATFGGLPNTHVSAESLALPGTLPMLNKEVIEKAIRLGIALNCTINQLNAFDRKHYFYADLPKGYQTTQDRLPICIQGFLNIRLSNGVDKVIRINRIHLEEDAGKTMHDQHAEYSFVDLNRAGVPLVEIVTEPDIKSPEEAALVLTEIRKLVRFLDVGDGNMEEGSLRCDANISIRPFGDEKLYTRCEVKNLNSTRNLRNAIAYEFTRQVDARKSGTEISQSTLNFDPDTGVTSPMRTKEEANDYRYFADPDLPPIFVNDEWLSEIYSTMPKLPAEAAADMVKAYNMSSNDALFIAEDKALYAYFIEAQKLVVDVKILINWLQGPIKSILNDRKITIDEFSISPEKLSEIVNLVIGKKISQQQAIISLIPAAEVQPSVSIYTLAESLNIIIEDNEAELNQLIARVLTNFESQVNAYKKGKKGLIGLFVGEVLKLGNGKLDPQKVNILIKKKLE